jgi:hypothetical protein
MTVSMRAGPKYEQHAIALFVSNLTTNGSNKQYWKSPVIHQPSCHGADREVDTLVHGLWDVHNNRRLSVYCSKNEHSEISGL